MSTWELWKSQADSSYTLVESGRADIHELVGPDAQLVASIEAADYVSGKEKQHQILGWEPYKQD